MAGEHDMRRRPLPACCKGAEVFLARRGVHAGIVLFQRHRTEQPAEVRRTHSQAFALHFRDQSLDVVERHFAVLKLARKLQSKLEDRVVERSLGGQPVKFT